ncbi:MAG: hypothetical protein AB8B95_10825 [Pseudohongiellaceae bacterium]
MVVSPETPATLNCSFEIDELDVSKNGSTYMIAQAEGLGSFQVNETGAYVPWNGEISSLVPSSTQNFTTSVSLMPFNNIKFADFGVTNTNLTVFFAYSIAETGDLVFTPQGVRVTIQ